jgi:hypothetical protein
VSCKSIPFLLTLRLSGRQSQVTGRTTFGLLDLFFSAVGFFLGCLSFGCLGFGG